MSDGMTAKSTLSEKKSHQKKAAAMVAFPICLSFFFLDCCIFFFLPKHFYRLQLPTSDEIQQGLFNGFPSKFRLNACIFVLSLQSDELAKQKPSAPNRATSDNLVSVVKQLRASFTKVQQPCKPASRKPTAIFVINLSCQ